MSNMLIIDRIIDSYQKAKQQNVSKIYKPTKEWLPQAQEKAEIYENYLDKPEEFEKILKNFFRDKKLAHGIFNDPDASHILEYLQYRNNISNIDFDEISVPDICNPPIATIGTFCLSEGGIMNAKVDFKITYGTLRFYHFSKEINKLTKNIERPIIVEIGGGFGGFAYYLLKNNPKIKYICYDIPELLPIISYYLFHLFPEKKIMLYDNYKKQDLNNFDICLLPNFELLNLPTEYVDLFYNSRSISEMNIETIDEYLKQIKRTLKHKGYFFHENTNNSKFPKPYKRVMSSDFPIPEDLKLISEKRSLFYDERYYEYLYQKTAPSKKFSIVIDYNKIKEAL